MSGITRHTLLAVARFLTHKTKEKLKMLKRVLFLSTLLLAVFVTTSSTQVRELPEPPCYPCHG